MSFFNTKFWAKIPTDLLENKAMSRVEKELSPELRCAPVLLYLAGAGKADNDGIFDIGDAEEFASLIKVDSPEKVRQVADAMVKLRILAHVPDSSVYIFVEWEYSTREKPLTLRDRFNAACKLWKNKLEESSFFVPQSTKVDNMRTNATTPVNECFNTIQDDVNKCSNTIQTPSAQCPQNRREREDKSREEENIADVEKSTHTRVEGAGEEELPEAYELPSGSPASGNEKSLEPEQSQETTEGLITVPDWKIVPESDASEKPLPCEIDKEKADASFVPEEIGKIKGEVVEVFNNFFKSVNVAYNMAKGLKLVEAAAGELVATVGNQKDAPDLARRMCEQFQKMHDEPEPNKWHGIPLFPAYLVKDPVWQALLSRVKLPDNNPVTSAGLPRTLTAEEKAATDSWLKQQCLDYGIDPGTPNAFMQVVVAKRQAADGGK